MVDNEGGIHQALSHLVEHGHSRIAFAAGDAGPPQGDTVDRLQGYLSSLQKLGLPFDARLVAYGTCDYAGGWQAVKQMLSTGACFTAVVAHNDGSAEGCMAALRDAGLSVPEEVAVIGFDDRLEARSLTPPLTTVRHPMLEMGYQALLLLLRYIAGRAEGVETIRVPTTLIVRESCGCLPGMTAGRGASQHRELAAHHGDREHGGDPRRLRALRASVVQSELQVVQAMSAAVSAEMRRLGEDQVGLLCQELMAAFRSSLEQGSSMAFHLAMQRVLECVAAAEEDLHIWQAALSALRDSLPVLLVLWPGALDAHQVQDMLDQARMAISARGRAQDARYAIRRAVVADRVGRMTARFLAARDEPEVLQMLSESLPGIGIQHATVALYEPEGEDAVAWSVVHRLPHPAEGGRRVRTREFPPPGLYAPDGPFSLALLPLWVQEEVSGFVAFDGSCLEPCADIVRQLAAALRGVRLYCEAVEGRRLAEEANRLKSRFLSMVSHELRTPLNLIAGLSDILLREGGASGGGKVEIGRKDLQRIYVSAQHLDGLIRDVLDLAHSEVGQLRLVCEPLDLAEVLGGVAAIGEHLARDKGLAWRSEIPEDLPQVWGDRTRLRQVALNLVNNAAKFTSRGEVALIVSAENSRVRVAVQDTGLGIPVEELDVIFDEFRQSERATARGYGGLGLGLAICKRLVELHGGEIGAHSSGKEGGGSTFYFTLPVMGQRTDWGDGIVSPAQTGRIVVLVKDARGGNLLRAHLVQRGFAVEVLQLDGTDEWLRSLRAGPPEAVVLDLGLASERGWETLRALKENPATQHVPVLFYTLAKEEDSGSILELDYLTKPIRTAELTEALLSRGLLTGSGGEKLARKILLVDDEPEALEIYARIVRAQSPHYRVLRARNGREALELIRAERPHLMLLDLMMPELDGFGLLEAMQEEEASRQIPVIVVTAQTLTQEDAARLNRGVASVLGKGLFTVGETLAHVEAALAGRRRLGSDGQGVVRRAVAYVHAHYAEPISRGDVASHVGVSERHLSRCFRQEMGVTLTTYLNRCRVRQARALLELGDKSITQVAMEVGFSSGGYFARVFREEVGVSPSTYLRRQCRSEPWPCEVVLLPRQGEGERATG
jgi:signal transduction histidine kinase/DNA-binding response OmpR family regulator